MLFFKAIVSKNNPYLRNDNIDLSATHYIKIDMRENNLSTQVYRNIREKYELKFLNVNVSHNIYNSSLNLTKSTNYDDFNIHKVYVEKYSSLLLIKFYNITNKYKLQVIVTPYPPSLEDFKNNIIVPMDTSSPYYRKEYGINTLCFELNKTYTTEKWENFIILYVGILNYEQKISIIYYVEFLSPICRRWSINIEKWTNLNCEVKNSENTETVNYKLKI